MAEQVCEQLTFFPADFLASLSPLPGSAEASRMTATSGRRCFELYGSCGQLGSLERMLLELSTWRSTRCYLTWKAKVTPAERWYFRLWPSTPRTGETDVPLLHTVTAFDATGLPGAVRLWPTPSASDGGRTAINPHVTKNGTIRHIGKSGGQSYARLGAVAALFPTPIATDYKNRGCKDSRKNWQGQLQTEIGGALNPDWVEWLMGFPTGWTEV